MAAVEKKHKIGYIGFGSMVSHYHYDTAMREDIAFAPAAVFDIDPDARALAESRGLKAFDNLKDFLDSKLFDFVLVGTSNQFHCEYVCAALEAGYDTMCEKPVAMTSDEIRKMIATSKKTGKLFTVHHNRRWDKDFLVLKKALADHDVGKLFRVENRVGGKDGGGQMGGWRGFEDHGGGMLLDWGVHMLDQTLFLIEEPVKSVDAQIVTIRGGEIDDYSKVLIRFESGLVAQVESSTFNPIPLPKWLVVGENGAVVVPEICSEKGAMARVIKKSHWDETAVAPYYTHDKVETRSQPRYIVDEWEEAPIDANGIPQDWAALYKNLAGVLDGTEKLVVTPESVLRCFEVIEAAFRSAKEGHSIEF